MYWQNRTDLINGKQTSLRKTQHNLHTDDPFVQLWRKLIGIVVAVVNEFDRQWQKRRRVLNTLLIILFVFRQKQTRLGNHPGRIRGLLNIPLPQTKPVAASAFCNARKKLDEQFFKRLNTKILKATATHLDAGVWKNHRLFAVDGSKLNLPRQLRIRKYGYKGPSAYACYPQGLLSCLYRLKPKLPIDFDLVAHGRERTFALLAKK